MSSVASPSYDLAVIGGGIAGVTAAANLATDLSLVLLEQETELAYHTTSRSAAMYFESDDAGPFGSLVAASRPFFDAEHPELDAPLLKPMPVLILGEAERRTEFERVARSARTRSPHINVEIVEGTAIREWCPVLSGVAELGRIETTSAEIDVMGLHQLYVRRTVAAGGTITRAAGVGSIGRGRHRRWRLETAAGPVEADLIVNAAGAWADQVAVQAGVEPVGLSPLRRTAFTVRTAHDSRAWPFIFSEITDLTCYFKPEAGNQLLCSPADETPVEPGDARAEEIDVATAIDRLNTLTTLDIRSVVRTWAGQRTFSPDRCPVWGFDDEVEGFFWFAGQGGWGIGTAPAAGLLARGLILDDSVPASLHQRGVEAETLSPARFR